MSTPVSTKASAEGKPVTGTDREQAASSPQAGSGGKHEVTVTIPLDRIAHNAANAAMLPLAVARQVLPAKGGLPLYLGLGALGAVGVLEWPVAVGIGAGYAILRGAGPLRPPSSGAPGAPPDQEGDRSGGDGQTQDAQPTTTTAPAPGPVPAPQAPPAAGSTISDIMTSAPVTIEASTPIVEAARRMREADIGAVLVQDGEELRGVVTDRDLVVRALAEGTDPRQTPVGSVCSETVVTVSPGDDIGKAVELMREHAVRRLPVVDDGHAVGIVSLGDVAAARDPDSALSDISTAEPNA